MNTCDRCGLPFRTESALEEHAKGHAWGRIPPQIERNAAIVSRLRNGERQTDLAREYGISRTRVAQLWRRRGEVRA